MSDVIRARCRHCPRLAARPRGLCFGCHKDLAVRAMYPSTSKFARRGVGVTGSYALPAEPTTAAAGSWEKVGVLAARAEAGVCLFHPGDSGVLAGVIPAFVEGLAQAKRQVDYGKRRAYYKELYQRRKADGKRGG